MTHAEDDIDAGLRAVAGGDRAAFRRIYRSASSKLFGIALRICRDRAFAEEAVQDTFMDIWRTAGTFDSTRGSAMAWMSVIARNRAIDVLRRHGRHGAKAVADGEAVLPQLPDPRAATDGGVAHMALVACLEALDQPARDMVLRAYYLGETREDLAARFDAPVNSVKTWLRRALQALKGCLDA
ncbi:MAG: sigma-70 family RNA polymerase sigma factor [Maritimibacter sp.]|nr:sigma-70 family RNA polymerase sigma factor [Maritimibacter sp.]